ncbi:MAG: helix-hairpin-helix domain-containing protein [Deltaproteobacteria bacterium]|nr:helix-hairpin-helix domain-containing protein [Deltaproteobacteria bacterium]
MLKMVVFKKRMWFGLCMLLMGLVVAPGLVVAVDKVNINTADKETLSSLPGVGPVIADRIIEYREKNELFKNKEEITEVKGIGEKTFQKIKDLIVVE